MDGMRAITCLYGTVQASKPPSLSACHHHYLSFCQVMNPLHLAIFRTLNFGLDSIVIGMVHWFVRIISAPCYVP